MVSEKTTDTIALGLTALFVVSILLYGLFIIQQLLLSGLIALCGILAYLAWRYLR